MGKGHETCMYNGFFLMGFLPNPSRVVVSPYRQESGRKGSQVNSSIFFSLRALSSALLNLSTLQPVGIWLFGNHRSKREKLCSCKSCWFLPDFLKWSGALPPSLSWLLRAIVAIFSLALLKCGCKKLLVQLASSSTEKDGTAASDRGGPASLPPTANFPCL